MVNVSLILKPTAVEMKTCFLEAVLKQINNSSQNEKTNYVTF